MKIDTPIILSEIKKQVDELRRTGREAKFVILDKVSYLTLNLYVKEHIIFGNCAPFSLKPPLQPPGHIDKIYGLTTVCDGSIALHIQVTSDPFTEAMR